MFLRREENEAADERWCKCNGNGGLNTPVPLLIEGALRVARFLSFLGRIVSVLGFMRREPPRSGLPRVERSIVAICDCGIELTVSVSTVMFRVPSEARDLLEPRPGYTALMAARFLGRIVEL
jgi:hypothetical protein